MKKVNGSGKGLRGPSRFFRKIAEGKGQFTLNGAITFLFVMFLLALFISAFSVINTAFKLHSVAADLSRYVEIRGMVDSAVYTELDRLANVVGVTIESHSITGAFSGGSKLQFGTDFTIMLTTTDRLGVGGVLSLPVPLETHVTGRSERYWK